MIGGGRPLLRKNLANTDPSLLFLNNFSCLSLRHMLTLHVLFYTHVGGLLSRAKRSQGVNTV